MRAYDFNIYCSTLVSTEGIICVCVCDSAVGWLSAKQYTVFASTLHHSGCGRLGVIGYYKLSAELSGIWIAVVDAIL